MKTIHFYLDFISPYAWLAFDALPRALEGISHRVVHKPVLFAAMLKHHGQLGPAEIPTKRDWTYRQVLWLARQQGTPLQLPAMHPFNPLGLLRLATACDADGTPSRYVCEKIFRHVWCTGQDAADTQRLAAERAGLRQQRDNVRLLAPANGVVISREAEVGSTVVAGQAVLRIDRTGYLASGRPVEFTRGLYRSDIYDFIAELRLDASPAPQG